MFTKRKYWMLFIAECIIINLTIAAIPMPALAKISVCPLIVILAGLKLLASLENLKLKTELEAATTKYRLAMERGAKVHKELREIKNDLTMDENQVPRAKGVDTAHYIETIAVQKKAITRGDEIIAMLRTLNEDAEQRIIINKAQINAQKDLIDRLKGG